MIFRTKEAQEEHESNERINRILEGGGCWITHTENDAKHCLGQREKDSCEACEAYQAFYQCAECYKQSPDVNTWQEAVWLADQFYGIKSPYMCNGFEEEWCKEHDPERYKEALKRQEFLLNGKSEEKLQESEEKVHTEINGQMTIMDWFEEAEG